MFSVAIFNSLKHTFKVKHKFGLGQMLFQNSGLRQFSNLPHTNFVFFRHPYFHFSEGSNLISECHQALWLYTSVGPKPEIPKESQLIHFGTENFEQFRFQSI